MYHKQYCLPALHWQFQVLKTGPVVFALRQFVIWHGNEFYMILTTTTVQAKVKLLSSLCLKFTNHLNGLNLTWVDFVDHGIQCNASDTGEETENLVKWVDNVLVS